jgi:uncharacterized protein
MRRTLVWRGLDAPRMEIAHVHIEVDGTELRARGAQIGVEPTPYELHYEVEPGRLRAHVVGGASLDLELNADFFDLGYSPIFNSLPILRHDLHRGGDARDFVMAWVSVPDLSVSPSEQRYEPIRPGLVRYRGSHRPDAPYYDLEIDEDGFVKRYPRLAELVRVSP